MHVSEDLPENPARTKFAAENYRLQQRGVLWSQSETSVGVLTNCISKACAWCKSPDIKPGNFWWNGTISFIRETREIDSRLLGEIYESPTNPLRIVYDELYRLSTTGHTTWCTHVGDLLTSIGLENIWEGQMIPVSAFYVNQIKSHFKTELERQYTRKWLQEINDREQNPKLRTYAIFKENHCLETYIQCLSVKKYQQAIFRFQVSSHRLGIELGRQYKPRLQVEPRLAI